MTLRIWTPAEIDVVRDEYPHKPTKEIAARLNRSRDAVKHVAKRLGVVKTVEARTADLDFARSLATLIPFPFKHGRGMDDTTYRCWFSMRQRCENSRHKSFANYGGRGITVCPEWVSFERFLQDMGDCPKGMSLGRVDNARGYSKENCRWETWTQQANNRRTNHVIEAFGFRRTLTEWAKEAGMAPPSIMRRIKKGWSVEAAISTPPSPQHQLAGFHKGLSRRRAGGDRQ